jgi:hypothetical protein
MSFCKNHLKGAKIIFIVFALFFIGAGIYFQFTGTIITGAFHVRGGGTSNGIINAPGLYFFAAVMIWMYRGMLPSKKKQNGNTISKNKKSRYRFLYEPSKSRRLIRPKRNPKKR